MALKGKQARFVEEYLIDLNATQAAIRAGYSPKTAYVIGIQNLRKLQIAEAIAIAQAERSKRVSLTQDQVVQELAVLDFSNVQHYQIDDYGNLTLAEGVPEAAMRAVSSLKRKVRHSGSGDEAETTYETEIKLWDKVGSLRLTAQHLGMLVERHEVTGKHGGPVQHAHVHHLAEALDAAIEEAYGHRNGHSTSAL